MATRTLSVPAQRNFASVTATTIGAAMPAVQVANNLLGGVYLTPIKYTPAVAVNRPITVYVLLSPAANSLIDGQNVVLQLACTRINADGTRTELSFNQTWPVPNGWLTTDTTPVLLDNGNGVSYDAGEFPDQANAGLRVARVGADPLDTFAQALQIAEFAVLQYTAREWTIIV